MKRPPAKVSETVKRLLAVETSVETGFTALRAETKMLGEGLGKLDTDVTKGLAEVVAAVEALRDVMVRALAVDDRMTQLETRVAVLEARPTGGAV